MNSTQEGKIAPPKRITHFKDGQGIQPEHFFEHELNIQPETSLRHYQKLKTQEKERLFKCVRDATEIRAECPPLMYCWILDIEKFCSNPRGKIWRQDGRFMAV